MNLPPLSDLPTWSDFDRVALDIETRDDDLKKLGPGVRRGGYITGISFCCGDEDGPAFYLPMRHEGGGNYDDPERVLEYVRDMARHFRGEMVGCNLPYDLDYLEEAGVNFTPVFFRDIQVSGPLLDEPTLARMQDKETGEWFWGEEFHYMSLNAQAERLGVPGKDEAGLIAWAAERGLNPKADMWKAPAKVVSPYAVQDVRLPMQISTAHGVQIQRQDLERVHDLESKLLPVLLKMRRRGVAVDMKRVEQFSARAWALENKACREVSRLVGRTMTPDDTTKSAALAKLLEAGGVKVPLTEQKKSQKTGKMIGGNPSVKNDWLKSLNTPLGEAIIIARRWNKIRTTFCASIQDHEIKGRIHCTFNQLRQEQDDGEIKGAQFGRLSCTKPNLQQQPVRYVPEWRTICVPDEGGQWACLDFSCYDDTTEILTPSGWTKFPELKQGDAVAQWDDGEVSYVVPPKVHTYEFDGEMVRVRGNRQVDFLLTPNHDCVLRRKNGELHKIKAGEWGMKKSDDVCPQSGMAQGTETEGTNLIRLIVAIQADASRRAGSYRFFVSKQRKIDRLEMLLNGRQFTRGFSPAKGNQTSFEVRDGWDIDKYLGPFKTFRRDVILRLTPGLRKIFLQELLLWDGSLKQKSYLTTNKKNAEIVQEVAILTGYRSNIVAMPPKGIRKKIQYRVSLNEKSGTIVKSVAHTMERYRGKVYCVTVPSGAIMVRRNGRVGISGNSQEPRMITNYAERTGCRGGAEAAEACRTDPNWDNHSMMAGFCYGDFNAQHYIDHKKAAKGSAEERLFKAAKDLREKAKTIFLARCYGMGGGKLCTKLGLPTIRVVRDPEASRWTVYQVDSPEGKALRQQGARPFEMAGPEGELILAKFDEGVPYVKQLTKMVQKKAQDVGYIVTLMGRRCRFPTHPETGKLWQAHKGLNRLIQGSSADQTKTAMVIADDAGVRMQLQVHDELDLTIWDLKEARELEEIMVHAIELNVPTMCDIEVGPNWGELKAVA